MIQSHLVLILALTAPAADNADAVKQEKKVLAGGWSVVSAERDGESLPEDEIRKMRVSFAEERLTLKQGEKVSLLPYRLDLTNSPHEIVLVPNDGPQKGKAVPGIYELKGETLKVCLSLKPEAGVPDDFTTTSGSGRMLLVLKREK